jgi:FAD/FMN-containing dehydrogenase
MTLAPGADGFYHPATEDQVRELILHARHEGRTVRVRGAGHSTAAAIYTDGFDPEGVRGGLGINVLLDRLAAVSFDESRMQVTVQAGCHLGRDPTDPSGTSTLENSLFYQLDRRGWALPDTGGIIHQTVAGFLSTGSSGGSLQHSVGDQIVTIRLIDGQGNARELSDASDPDLFAAAGVSMGLLGIVTQVTFQCVPRFDVIGQQATSSVDGCAVDLFAGAASGKPGLEEFLRQTEHARLMWWPQRGVRRIVVWQGRTMQAGDYGAETGTRDHFHPKPYQEFPVVLGSDAPAQLFGSAFYNLIRFWNAPGPLGGLTRGALSVALAPVIKIFVGIDGTKGPVRFWDAWWRALPMDNQASDRLLPTRFTEMWLPISKTAEAMARLRDHYERHGLAATGPYACEIYATKRSRFWMSPAHDRDVVKIDMFWFGHDVGDPAERYYPQFWALLKDLDYRLHWGKYLPDDTARFLPARFPRWHDFLRIREQLDPGRVFLTRYWRAHLGI